MHALQVLPLLAIVLATLGGSLRRRLATLLIGAGSYLAVTLLVTWAIAIPIGLVLAEEILIGTHFVLSAIGSHLPHMVDGDDSQSMGIYVYGPVWSQLDYLGMVMGVVFAALALSGAVWLRRYRFET